jgi:RNA-directed DNA polymerase
VSSFDTVDHGWLLRFLEHRIADRRVLRLIRQGSLERMLGNGHVRCARDMTSSSGVRVPCGG